MRTKLWLPVLFILVAFINLARAGQAPLADGAQLKAGAVEPEAQKKLQSERTRKTLRIYKALRPEDAARLIDRLDEKTAADILNSLDQKTVTNLIPYLNQPRVLKWTRETLAGR